MKKLATNGVFITLVLGLASYAFTIGGLSFWGPKYITERYGIDNTTVAIVFGLSIVVTSMIGTVVGSLFLDYEYRK